MISKTIQSEPRISEIIFGGMVFFKTEINERLHCDMQCDADARCDIDHSTTKKGKAAYAPSGLCVKALVCRLLW